MDSRCSIWLSGSVVIFLSRLMMVIGLGIALIWNGHVFVPSSVAAAESADVYFAVGLVGGFPEDRGLALERQAVRNFSLHNSMGGGLKAGIFPDFTRRIVGIELEYFGATGRLSARTAGSGRQSEGTSGLSVLNSMTNIMIRNPGGHFRPYIGLGIGYSSGILHGANFAGRSNQDFDSTAAFAYQLIAGFQFNLSDRTFLFSEYKRLTANFHWNDVALDYHAHYAVAGIGWNF